MISSKLLTLLSFLLLYLVSPICLSDEESNYQNKQSAISFVEINSLNLETTPPSPLIIKGKLKMPAQKQGHSHFKKYRRNLPAVVILHSSAGVDATGDFYATALNDAGIATLEIDMWEARGLNGGLSRPQLPIFTYPDAFAALKYLADHELINPKRIGVIGFSWGGVVSMAAAEELYAAQFGQGLKFAAHVANYPVCYSYNNPSIPALNPPDQRGTQWKNLTGAPVLIQIGTEDDYDNGAQHCLDLPNDLSSREDKRLVEVAAYDGAYHGWDRLLVPTIVKDPFADEGSFFSTGTVPDVRMIPDVKIAYKSLKKTVNFFLKNL